MLSGGAGDVGTGREGMGSGRYDYTVREWPNEAGMTISGIVDACSSLK
jgi:hypothetical protein